PARAGSGARPRPSPDNLPGRGRPPARRATVVDIAGTPPVLQPGRGELRHPLAAAPVEAQLLAAPEQPPAQPDDRVGNLGRTREGVDAELDLAGVQPLPHLVIHLALLQVALERAIVPAPHPHGAAIDLPGLVVDAAHAH